MSRIFLLSPANCGGSRAKQILSTNATFALAQQLRSNDGAPLGDVFAFVSGLYFRGKLTYARRFAAPPDENFVIASGIHVITANSGLRNAETRITERAFRAFGNADIDLDNPGYRRPLEQSAQRLADEIGAECDVVLLGSIASAKYVDVLLDIFGSRLRFPREFVGRGDMSRGGLLLRMAAAGQELEYVPVDGAIRHGQRPPKLPPLPRAKLPAVERAR